MTFYPPAWGRTVLFMTDDALCIYKAGSVGARLVEVIPWSADGFEKNVANVLVKDCSNKPVVIINDMLEQHYRKERLIRSGIGIFDRAAMLKRKVQMSFPNYPARSALQLKEKIRKAGHKKAADVYILAAIPPSAAFQKTLAAVQRSLVRVVGFFLLPVESCDMLSVLSQKLAKSKKQQARWVVFMGQHKNGGLRQIVTKDGELALTRMTPLMEPGGNPSAWAAEVHKEFKATMSYLSRFGYQVEDGLDIIVIADAPEGDALESLIETECTFSSISTADAARMVGVSIAQDSDESYADALHVAWAGQKKKFILPLDSADVDSIAKPRQAALMASVGLVLATIFLGFQLFNQFYRTSQIEASIRTQEAMQAQLNVKYQREIQKREGLGFDIRLLTSSLSVYEALEKERIKPLEIFSAIGGALGKDLRLDRVSIERPKSSSSSVLPGAGGAPGAQPLFEANLLLSYPSTTDIDRGNKEVEALAARIQNALPNHKVKVSKFLRDYEYIEEMVVETGARNHGVGNQDYIAEITIAGVAQND